MKIFITGTSSFVANEFIKQCDHDGHQLTGCDITESTDSRFCKADICSKDLPDIMPTGIDVVVHLAALSTDNLCSGRAYETFENNVMATLNVIKSAEKAKCKRFIFSSTEWVYESFNDGIRKNEDTLIDIGNIDSEYALSKLVSEANLRQQFNGGFCDTTILRFGIIYGRRVNNWSAVESIFFAIKENEFIEVGSLKNGRHFIHVRDIARGISKSLGLSGFNIINLQGERLLTLGEIIDKTKKILGIDATVKELDGSECNVRPISNKKAKQLLNWVPEVGLEEGLWDLKEYFDGEIFNGARNVH